MEFYINITNIYCPVNLRRRDFKERILWIMQGGDIMVTVCTLDSDIRIFLQGIYG